MVSLVGGRGGAPVGGGAVGGSEKRRWRGGFAGRGWCMIRTELGRKLEDKLERSEIRRQYGFPQVASTDHVK
jgi:hypothetical protein